MRTLRFNPGSLEGLRQLDRELDLVADKHGIEPPLEFMPLLEDLDSHFEEDE